MGCSHSKRQASSKPQQVNDAGGHHQGQIKCFKIQPNQSHEAPKADSTERKGIYSCKCKPTLCTCNCTVSKPQLKALIIADKNDKYFKELAKAIDKAKFSNVWVRTIKEAINCFPNLLPNLIFVDVRHTDHKENFIRAMRSTQPMIFVAIVEPSQIEKADTVDMAVRLGYDKILIENSGTNLHEYLTEAQNALNSQEIVRTSMAISESVYTALDKSRDLVLITDTNSIVQYVNCPFALVLGYSRDEIIGKQATIYQDHMDLVPALRQLEKGFEWLGKIRWRSKSGDIVGLQCRALPFSPLTTLPTHYLYMQDNPFENHIYPRGSLPSIRKGSYDLKSIISEGSARRQSLAKLYNLPLEAPITKVLSLLCSAQENAAPSVVQMLEQVMDILRTTELYTSHLKTDNLRAEDPLTKNLIAALVAPATSAVMPRRSSSESIVTKKKPGIKKNNVMLPMSKELREEMDKISSWDFDVIQIEKMTSCKPLVYIGMRIFSTFSVHRTLAVDEKTIYGWLVTMEKNYKPANTYHNSTHAADVLQATACFLIKLRQKKLLDPLDEACCLIAATAHDLGHPGKSNTFLTNSSHDLAILYNDNSVLEQHHAALTFKLTLSDERINIFKGLDRKTYPLARACIIEMILATDMSKHYEHYTKFVTVFNKPNEENAENRQRERKNSSECDNDGKHITPEDIMLVKRMLIKCADVSNPTRPIHLCKQWAGRIAEEYIAQTDEEKSRDLPIILPGFDRDNLSIPKTQIGFMDYIVNAMIEEWDSFIEMPEMLYHLRKNYDYWRELSEKGVTGIEDPEKRRSSIENCTQVEQLTENKTPRRESSSEESSNLN